MIDRESICRGTARGRLTGSRKRRSRKKNERCLSVNLDKLWVKKRNDAFVVLLKFSSIQAVRVVGNDSWPCGLLCLVSCTGFL